LGEWKKVMRRSMLNLLQEPVADTLADDWRRAVSPGSAGRIPS
jgi:hypothetical protein